MFNNKTVNHFWATQSQAMSLLMGEYPKCWYRYLLVIYISHHNYIFTIATAPLKDFCLRARLLRKLCQLEECVCAARAARKSFIVWRATILWRRAARHLAACARWRRRDVFDIERARADNKDAMVRRYCAMFMLSSGYARLGTSRCLIVVYFCYYVLRENWNICCALCWILHWTVYCPVYIKRYTFL